MPPEMMILENSAEIQRSRDFSRFKACCRACYNLGMTPKLSPELQSAVQEQLGNTLEVVDDAGESYVLIPKATYVHLRNLSHDADEATRYELQRLVQHGIDSGAGLPAEQVFAELRQLAASLAVRPA